MVSIVPIKKISTNKKIIVTLSCKNYLVLHVPGHFATDILPTLLNRMCMLGHLYVKKIVELPVRNRNMVYSNNLLYSNNLVYSFVDMFVYMYTIVAAVWDY